MLVMFGTLILLLVLGMPVFFAMGIAAIAYLISTTGDIGGTPLVVIPQTMMNGVDSFLLLAIPMFILAGELINKGGVTLRLIKFAKLLVGHLPGGLSQVNIVMSMIMAGMSGSSVADAAATSSVLIPAMEKAGYPRSYAAGITAASSTIGPVIPPSIPMVIIGGVTGVSIGRLFLGGAIPGLLMGLTMMVVAFVLAKRYGFEQAPRASCREVIEGFGSAILALIFPVIVLGSIVAGIATPTEAAGIAVAYALVLGVVIYREISFRQIPPILVEVGVTTATIAVTIGVAKLMGWIASAERAGDIFESGLLGISSSPVVILMIINVALLLMGCLMEVTPIILLVAPVLFPIVEKVGIDPIHFGVVMTVNLMIGLVTPPVGVTLFVTSAVAGVPIMQVARSAAPFLVAIVVVLLLITYYPPLVLWLPNTLMAGR